MWYTGEGNGKPFQYSCLENPMNSMKRQNDRILKEELPRLVGAQYATGDHWRNTSRKNEGTCCMAQETQTGALCQSRGMGWGRRWEGGSKGRGYMYIYGLFMLRFDRKQQNSVKQLSFNKKKIKKIKERRDGAKAKQYPVVDVTGVRSKV